MATAVLSSADNLVTIKVADIKVGDHREDVGDIEGLATSIKNHGLIDAIVVSSRQLSDDAPKSVPEGAETATKVEYWLAAGYRRLLAVRLLKWETVQVKLYENLSEYERQKVELEEELAQKKVRSWQEEIAIKQRLHELYMAEFGGNQKRQGSHGSKKWSQQKTAEKIGEPRTTLSEDIRLAEAIKQFPELKKAGTKKDALRKMYILRERALLQEIARRQAQKGVKFDDNVELLCGSAYELLKEQESESFDCCITDPPWGIDIQAISTARSTEYNEFKDDRDVWKQFLKDGLPEIFRVLKEGAHFWLFYGPEHYQATLTALEKTGFEVRYVPCIWVKEKPNYTDTEYKPMPMYESFFFCIRRKNKEIAPRRLNEATSDVFTYSRELKGRIHRTEKPIELIKRLINLSTQKGDRIIDPFAGSASTLCAALVTERKALGFELDPDMHSLASGKLQNLKIETETADA